MNNSRPRRNAKRRRRSSLLDRDRHNLDLLLLMPSLPTKYTIPSISITLTLARPTLLRIRVGVIVLVIRLPVPRDELHTRRTEQISQTQIWGTRVLRGVACRRGNTRRRDTACARPDCRVGGRNRHFTSCIGSLTLSDNWRRRKCSGWRQCSLVAKERLAFRFFLRPSFCR
jgi:hypothetical protein